MGFYEWRLGIYLAAAEANKARLTEMRPRLSVRALALLRALWNKVSSTHFGAAAAGKRFTRVYR